MKEHVDNLLFCHVFLGIAPPYTHHELRSIVSMLDNIINEKFLVILIVSLLI